jgi:AAA15 family ATPase/GTPase
MKIKELTIKNHTNGWELESTKFSDLTLLVGASGVGKTQILKSIQKLIDISNGKAFEGIQWDLLFTVDNGDNYRWTGRFESKTEQSPNIMDEALFLNKQPVFKRDQSTLKYEGKETPKIDPQTSVLNLFTTEDKIKPIKDGFKKIALLQHGVEQDSYPVVKNIKLLVEKYKEDISNLTSKTQSVFKKKLLEFIKIEHRTLIGRFIIVWEIFRDEFDEIVNDFKEVFPQVEDVQFDLIEEKEVYELQIKEKGTPWISQKEISSGMFKTLMHIAEMKLMADGYVILIDEFENSLGVNCIDIVAENLLAPGKNTQYIITSHHPYIINNIDMKHWKVVTRKGGRVSCIDAEQLKLGKSKHEAFKQLLNLDVFTEGIS